MIAKKEKKLLAANEIIKKQDNMVKFLQDQLA